MKAFIAICIQKNPNLTWTIIILLTHFANCLNNKDKNLCESHATKQEFLDFLIVVMDDFVELLNIQF